MRKRRQLAEAGDVALLFADQSKALTLRYLTGASAKASAGFIAHVQDLVRLDGLKPGAADKPVILVFENAIRDAAVELKSA